MKTLMTLISLMILAGNAHAEAIATGGFFDPIARIFTKCDNCQAMEKLRTEIFVPAHRDIRRKTEASKAMAQVYEHGDRLGDIAERDRVSFRGAHYAQEITSFYYLAADAVQFDQELQVAEKIAYLNQELGSRNLFEKVLNDEVLTRPENFCRRDFFKRAVEIKECDLAGKPNCPRMVGSVAACEARLAARRQVR